MTRDGPARPRQSVCINILIVFGRRMTGGLWWGRRADGPIGTGAPPTEGLAVRLLKAPPLRRLAAASNSSSLLCEWRKCWWWPLFTSFVGSIELCRFTSPHGATPPLATSLLLFPMSCCGCTWTHNKHDSGPEKHESFAVKYARPLGWTTGKGSFVGESEKWDCW